MLIAHVASGRVVYVSTVPTEAEIPVGWHEVPDGIAVEPGWWLIDGAWLAPDPRRAAILSGASVVLISTADANAPGRPANVVLLEDGSPVEIGWWRVGETWLTPDPRRAAIVVDGIVTQIVGLDASDPDRPDGAVLLEAGSSVAPGWHYAAGTFAAPVIGPAAIVTDGVVTNLIRVDVDAPPALDGLVLVPDGVTVAIGYGWDGTVFSPLVVALADLKTAKLAALDAACAAAIVGTDEDGAYTSDALGALHRYPNRPTDQTNMLGSVLSSFLGGGAGWETPFWCREVSSGIWAFRPHTIAQIQAAGLAGKDHVALCQLHLADLVAAVEAAPDAAAVAAISW